MIPTPVDPQESDDDLELEQVQFRLKTLMSCLLSAVCCMRRGGGGGRGSWDELNPNVAPEQSDKTKRRIWMEF
jgi:hypothetical protein